MHPGIPPAPDQTLLRDAEREAARSVLAGLPDVADLRGMATAVQAALGYIPPPAVPLLAERTGVERASVFDLVAADEELSFARPGRHRVAVCLGKNCSRRGAAQLLDEARRTLGIDLFRLTPDLAVRLEPFYCFGKCQEGPNVRIDDRIHGAMTPARLAALLGSIREPG